MEKKRSIEVSTPGVVFLIVGIISLCLALFTFSAGYKDHFEELAGLFLIYSVLLVIPAAIFILVGIYILLRKFILIRIIMPILLTITVLFSLMLLRSLNIINFAFDFIPVGIQTVFERASKEVGNIMASVIFVEGKDNATSYDKHPQTLYERPKVDKQENPN